LTLPTRGLPYYDTLYGLQVDRLGMASYQHSADIAGNLIASGAGFATLRDYAKLSALYLQASVLRASAAVRATSAPAWARLRSRLPHSGNSCSTV
jgi:hypothetical protein